MNRDKTFVALAVSAAFAAGVATSHAQEVTGGATTTAKPMEMRGRAMRGWLHVDRDDLRTRRQLARWVEIGAAAAEAAR